MTALDPLAVLVTIASWSAAALVLRAAWPLRGVCAMRRSPAAARLRASIPEGRATPPDRT